jgi:geranylgeranyl diphosphate synthase type II
MSKNLTLLSEAIEREVAKMNFGENPEQLYEPIRYTMRMGGKRMRPLLALMAYRMFGQNWESILHPAIAVEVFHNFTLLHDDIMDKAPLRRGMPTVHAKWNDTIAILSGDVMLVKAYDLLLESPSHLLPSVLRHFNKTATEVCEGQQWDMNFETMDSVDEAQYLEMIRLKTAVLLGHSLWLGTRLAGASEAVCDQMYAVGENMGLGFQLMDDFLDVYAEQAKFGKQVGGDIIANKKTYMLIQALKNAGGNDARELSNWIEAKEFDPEEKVKAVTALYNRLGIAELCKAKMNEYYEKAFTMLDGIEALQEPKAELYDLMQGLSAREK